MQTRRRRRVDVSKKVHRAPKLIDSSKEWIVYEKKNRFLKKAKKLFSFVRGVVAGVGCTVLVTTDIDIVLPISLTINGIIATYLIDFTTLNDVKKPKSIEPK